MQNINTMALILMIILFLDSPSGGHAGLGNQGFSLAGTELNLNSNIDDYFWGNVTLAADDRRVVILAGIDVEEAFIQTTSLPYGFTFTGGRMFSDIGYLSISIPHVWDFADAPLVYTAMLG